MLSLCLAFVAGSAQAIAGAAAPALKVAILIFDRVEIVDYAGPFEVFGGAGYDVFTVAASKAPITTVYGMSVTPKYSFADAPHADIVVVPGGGVADARKSAPTLQWVRAQSAGALHTMSVCNGAFILASAGLLDGLSATTTYGLIPKLRREFPRINVVEDQRYVDNGKIITTAGLSAGIDGAFHLVAVMGGDGLAQQDALGIEYDWHAHGGFVRAALADRLIPRIDLSAFGQWEVERTEGDRDHWLVAIRLTSAQPQQALARDLAKALSDAYAGEGNWATGARVASTGNTTNIAFADRAGHPWSGTLRLAGGASQHYTITYETRRSG